MQTIKERMHLIAETFLFFIYPLWNLATDLPLSGFSLELISTKEIVPVKTVDSGIYGLSRETVPRKCVWLTLSFVTIQCCEPHQRSSFTSVVFGTEVENINYMHCLIPQEVYEKICLFVFLENS